MLISNDLKIQELAIPVAFVKQRITCVDVSTTTIMGRSKIPELKEFYGK
jgi:hypothetical protein